MIQLKVDVDAASKKWARAFPKMNAKIEQAAAIAFTMAKKPAAFKKRSFDITITLTSDATIRKLNRDYRGKDKPTNVLSFPQLDLSSKQKFVAIPGVPIPLGDVVLAFETVKRECKGQDKNIENHTLHLVVHGVLHLLGYDHMNSKDATAMENLERNILDAMGYTDPYADMIL